jgi:hypothetical protein
MPPPPETGHYIEVVLPEDQTRLFLRVLLDGGWAGDLLFATADARSVFLDALTAGEISVVRRQVPPPDVYGELEVAPGAEAAACQRRQDAPARSR